MLGFRTWRDDGKSCVPSSKLNSIDDKGTVEELFRDTLHFASCLGSKQVSSTRRAVIVA